MEEQLNAEMEREILTPSYHGCQCRHNGENPDYMIACDECDYYMQCFPDWRYLCDMEGYGVFTTG